MQETTRNAPLKVLPCVGARLEVYPDRVRVNHPGWVIFVQTDCCFPLSAVRSVTIEAMNTFFGILRFEVQCKEQSRTRDVIFQRKYEALAWEVKNLIDEHIEKHDVLALIHEQFATVNPA